MIWSTERCGCGIAEARHARGFHVTVSEYELRHFHELIAIREVHFSLKYTLADYV